MKYITKYIAAKHSGLIKAAGLWEEFKELRNRFEDGGRCPPYRATQSAWEMIEPKLPKTGADPELLAKAAKHADPELIALVDRWPKLPAEVRRAVVDMAGAASNPNWSYDYETIPELPGLLAFEPPRQIAQPLDQTPPTPDQKGTGPQSEPPASEPHQP